ncbi:MAG TPA: hypothetical protein VLT82_10740, partial [Myxococcaceae bacterium]|nr:hypothetical protein [Myxococcaceae bacterium]
EDGQEIARLPCEQCRLFELSDDGSRVVGLNGERRRVWDVHGPSLVREEPTGGASGTSPAQLSSAGDRLGWLESGSFVLQEVSSGRRTRLALPEPGDTARISWDDTRVAIAWPGAVGVWTVPDLQRVWIAPNPSSVGVSLSWSADGAMVNVALEGSGAMLLDARTGETVARIVESRSGGGASQVNVLPTLRYRLTRDANSWALAPLPRPETGTPAESLRRALAEGGFQLRGVELEVVSR